LSTWCILSMSHAKVLRQRTEELSVRNSQKSEL
jgi:hypothetical protein